MANNDTIGVVARTRVLVVDDEPTVLKFISTILERGDYDVTTATSAREALDLCLSGERTFDLVLTDVIMPGMNGPEFVRQLRNKRGRIPVLFMTGYTSSHELDAPVIRKPFTSDELIFELKAVLLNRLVFG